MSSNEQQAVPLEPVPDAMDTSAPSQSNVTAEPSNPATTEDKQQPPPPLSKNAQKRLRKQQEWEAGRNDRRLKRKEKRQAHKVRVRTERAALVAAGADPSVVYNRVPKPAAVVVPVALVVDCDFEQYMTDKERISLSSQVTRAYSDNRNAAYQAHLWIAGFRGRLRERFDTALQAQHHKWKAASVFEGGFLECAVEARALMGKTHQAPAEAGTAQQDAGEETEQQQQLIGALQRSLDNPVPWTRDPQDPFPLPDPEPALDPAFRDVVYLSSDSPYTLERLEPHTTYVIGGLVDKNREKGLCYRRARELGIRTARLPIGEFMVMRSRQVLATNHVVDIMLKWLEFEDWGKAFLSVIPKRKGGRLRGEDGDDEEGGDGEEEEEEDAEEAEAEDEDGHQRGDDAEAVKEVDVVA